MATLQQKLFNQWMERNYKSLLQTMPQKDMLHSAYITVFHYRRPILPVADTFLQLMSEAYHRHILRELNHSMQFVLPDPLFWMYVDEDTPDEEQQLFIGQIDDEAEKADKHAVSDLEERQLDNLLAFVRSHTSPDCYIIFRLALLQQCDVSQIAEITGRSKPEIRKSLDEIDRLIRTEYHPKHRQ